MTHALEQSTHKAVGAVKRLLHTPAGSNAEAAAAVDAREQAMAILNGVNDFVSSRQHHVGSTNAAIRDGLADS